MFINLSPLRKYRDFRYLFFGQLISFLGSMVTYVAVPYQIYKLTNDNFLVGLLGLVQLGPVLIFGILGGTYADRLDRRKLLLISEAVAALLIGALAVNASLDHPSVVAIFIISGLFQAVNGFHRPSMDAMTQKLIEKEDYAAASALGSFRYSLGAILGPSLGGLLLAWFGAKGAFIFDFVTFAFAFISLALMSRMPPPEATDRSPWADAKAGMKFAVSKPELIGTYVIDIVAMVFAFPVALFPAMSEAWGGANAAGLLFSGMAIGSLAMTLLSGWTSHVRHHGRAVIIAATLWGVFIVGVGQAKTLPVAVAFLALAGAADMMSGLFRGIIWNHSVPNEFRGRLSGIEMISYMSGPLLGNARAGWVASRISVPFSITSGGILCAVMVIATAFVLPKFWKYSA